MWRLIRLERSNATSEHSVASCQRSITRHNCCMLVHLQLSSLNRPNKHPLSTRHLIHQGHPINNVTITPPPVITVYFTLPSLTQALVPFRFAGAPLNYHYHESPDAKSVGAIDEFSIFVRKFLRNNLLGQNQHAEICNLPDLKVLPGALPTTLKSSSVQEINVTWQQWIMAVYGWKHSNKKSE